MPEFRLRKTMLFSETIHHENGPPPAQPRRRARDGAPDRPDLELREHERRVECDGGRRMPRPLKGFWVDRSKAEYAADIYSCYRLACTGAAAASPSLDALARATASAARAVSSATPSSR